MSGARRFGTLAALGVALAACEPSPQPDPVEPPAPPVGKVTGLDTKGKGAEIHVRTRLGEGSESDTITPIAK